MVISDERTTHPSHLLKIKWKRCQYLLILTVRRVNTLLPETRSSSLLLGRLNQLMSRRFKSDSKLRASRSAALGYEEGLRSILTIYRIYTGKRLARSVCQKDENLGNVNSESTSSYFCEWSLIVPLLDYFDPLNLDSQHRVSSCQPRSKYIRSFLSEASDEYLTNDPVHPPYAEPRHSTPYLRRASCSI